MDRLPYLRDRLPAIDLETVAILRKLTTATRKLAELKGLAQRIPHQGILVNTLSMQEAKDSSAIESIVTTHDDLYKGAVAPELQRDPATKEVLRYRDALFAGYELVARNSLITTTALREIHRVLEGNDAGIRKQAGTVLKNDLGEIVYTPPQDHREVLDLLGELEKAINVPDYIDADPLIKAALIHYQFESIHPFSDGNGRVGRILNVLYLVRERLLDIPILYPSRYITRNKSKYYSLLSGLHRDEGWEEWIMYFLSATEQTATEALQLVRDIDELLEECAETTKKFGFYSLDLVKCLFEHPYVTTQSVAERLGVSYGTSLKYLGELTAEGVLRKLKHGKTNYYVNAELFALLASPSMANDSPYAGGWVVTAQQ